ncbi:oligosaccharide repeat unit polymerase [Cognatiyoonia sp. IB215446]|uniref:oligosaccharide repeat unit polymerase n=1 Tax=Cognatiyoonia sp. IB215446 TaxID=3097355 RepID=UPI002A103CAC|nr:oligosaccharide repeat unit polymerase [Cognatiyoonia sp. IB215446]MDX8347925.1 oligosaccharide repeat unit polymerase [Cognatiyoonia sp. IB215446]
MAHVLMILLAATATLIPLWIGGRHGLVRLVSPMYLLAYFCFFGFFAKVLAYAFQPELAFYRRFIDTPDAALFGTLYLALFIYLICVGYRLACAPSDRAANLHAARLISAGLARRGALSLCAFAVTTATIMLILRARGLDGLSLSALAGLNSTKQINVNADGVGATLAGLKSFFIIPKFAFVLLLAHGLVTGARSSQLQAVVLGLLLVLIALVSGDRFELAELSVFAIATFMIVGGRLRGHSVLIGVAGLIILGWLSAYMTSLRHGGDGSHLIEQIVGSTYFLDINAAIMVTDHVEPGTYLMGESYTWWSFGWIPRAIWVDKPAIDLGVFFKRDVMGVETGGAFNVTGPGEAFINFGWAGLAVAFVMGWVFRKGEALLLSSGATLRFGTAFLYPMLFYPFIQANLQSSFSAFIVGAVAQFILIAAMIAVFLPRYRLHRVPAVPQRSAAYAA